MISLAGRRSASRSRGGNPSANKRSVKQEEQLLETSEALKKLDEGRVKLRAGDISQGALKKLEDAWARAARKN
jgi:hypothetical protein